MEKLVPIWAVLVQILLVLMKYGHQPLVRFVQEKVSLKLVTAIILEIILGLKAVVLLPAVAGAGHLVQLVLVELMELKAELELVLKLIARLTPKQIVNLVMLVIAMILILLVLLLVVPGHLVRLLLAELMELKLEVVQDRIVRHTLIARVVTRETVPLPPSTFSKPIHPVYT